MPDSVNKSGLNKSGVNKSGAARRRAMPGADELFRPTTKASDPVPEPVAKPRASGRVKHDEKITVYVTADELLALEQARLAVRSMVGRNVDRGRLVRAALAAALEDFEENGDASDVVRRIQESTGGR